MAGSATTAMFWAYSLVQNFKELLLYSGWDLNPHALCEQGILSPSCLPFHHQSNARKRTFSLSPLIWHEDIKKSGKRDSNSRPRPWQGRALPTELFPLVVVRGALPRPSTYFNSLNVSKNFVWSGKRDSNSRPRPWQGRALPTELFPLVSLSEIECKSTHFFHSDQIFFHFFPTNFFISFSFTKASTGVSVSMSISNILSRISNKVGSSS